MTEITESTTYEEFAVNIKALIEEKRKYLADILFSKKKKKGQKLWVVERNLGLLQNITDKGISALYKHHMTMLKEYRHKDYDLFIVYNFPKDYAI